MLLQSRVRPRVHKRLMCSEAPNQLIIPNEALASLGPALFPGSLAPLVGRVQLNQQGRSLSMMENMLEGVPNAMAIPLKQTAA